MKPSVRRVHSDVWRELQEGSKFFMNQGDIHDTLRRLISRLEQEGLDYVLIGGMALVTHGYRRFTEDVDILMTKDDLEQFRQHCVGRGYAPAFSGASKSFRDTETSVRIEVVTSGEYPGDGKPKPVVYPDPKDVRVEHQGLWLVTLEKLIEFKLASGLSASHRLRDIADVQELILRLKLPLDFGEQLDKSVRSEYQRLWEAAQTASD
jgi:hypothetical protein